ncbi:hypothetical protein IW140_006134, partial [Coemansia sp. RSA 1813]
NKEEKPAEDSTGENTVPEETSTLSVSGIINSVRETRAAAQKHGTMDKKQREKKKKASEFEKTGSNEFFPEPPYAPFNTYRLVLRLVEAGYTREQAKTIMALFKHRVHETVEEVKANMLTKSDLENDAYLFRAALQELRTETQMIRKNDQAILESQLAAIDREIESLAQKINDEISNVRSDIEIEMNNHKHDTNHAMKSLDMKLHELSSKYQFVVGEMRTDVEANRLESIRHGLLAAVVTTLVLVGIVWAPELIKQLRERDSQARQKGLKSRENSGASAAGASNDTASGSQKVGDGILPSQQAEEMRRATWTAAANAANGEIIDGSMQSLPASQAYKSHTGGSSYRDHSFLNIHYDPTIFSAEQQKKQQQQEQADGYDDWFDSFFNSSQDNDKQERKDKSASLMESDSKLDSTFWSRQAAAAPEDGNDQHSDKDSGDDSS